MSKFIEVTVELWDGSVKMTLLNLAHVAEVTPKEHGSGACIVMAMHSEESTWITNVRESYTEIQAKLRNVGAFY